MYLEDDWRYIDYSHGIPYSASYDIHEPGESSGSREIMNTAFRDIVHQALAILRSEEAKEMQIVEVNIKYFI